MATYADNNIAKTSGYIAKEAGIGFYNNSVLTPMVDTQYSSEFGTVSGGARVGNTIRVKFPAQFITTDSKSLSSSTVQAIEEDTKVLTLDTRVGVHAEIDTEQATLEIEANGSEYSDRVLQPMGKALNAKIETLGFGKLALEAQNTIVVPDADLADGAKIRRYFTQARAMLDKQLAPQGDRSAVLGSDVEVLVTDSVLTLFHANSEIEAAYKEGKMGQFGGMTWLASNLVYTRVNGAGGTTGLTVTAYTEGADTITISSATGFAVGDKIVFTGTKLVNAESKIAYGNDIQRAVKKIVGNVLTIDPIYGPLSGAKQNAARLPIATHGITVLGEAGESYLVCPVFQKKAITLASADLYLPKNVEMASRNKVMNVAQRFIRDYEIGSDALPSRYESLITWAVLRPEWAACVEYKIS
jgi:hypothetical protein